MQNKRKLCETTPDFFFHDGIDPGDFCIGEINNQAFKS